MRKGDLMGRKVKIEFEEVAGYPQLGTVHVWVDGKELKDIERANFLANLKRLY